MHQHSHYKSTRGKHKNVEGQVTSNFSNISNKISDAFTVAATAKRSNQRRPLPQRGKIKAVIRQSHPVRCSCTFKGILRQPQPIKMKKRRKEGGISEYYLSCVYFNLTISFPYMIFIHLLTHIFQ